MGRKRENSLVEDMIAAPWWISAILAVVSYIGLKFLVPFILRGSSDLVSKALTQTAPLFAPILVLVFVFTAIMSLIVNFIKKKKEVANNDRREELFERQTSLPDISALTWKEFEKFIGEAYQRRGYEVEERGGSGADEGIDLILRKKGEKVLVQCKHWEAYQVGVNIVRELYGVVAAEGATKGIIVTTGYFTRDAEIFAHGKPMLLVRGNELSRLVEEGQKPRK